MSPEPGYMYNASTGSTHAAAVSSSLDPSTPDEKESATMSHVLICTVGHEHVKEEPSRPETR